MIIFKNITLKVHRQTLLDHAQLAVAAGEKVVARGASGCGKSSLLKTAVGGLPLAEGTVRVDGVELSAKTVADLRGRVAFIGQEPAMGAELTRDALLLPFTFKAHKHAAPSEARIAETLERLRLPMDLLEKPSKRISGGEKQRVALARALLLNKSIFLADEVTSALDPASRAAVMDALFQPGTTLLSVSHAPEWIERCDRVVEIVEGKIVEAAP